MKKVWFMLLTMGFIMQLHASVAPTQNENIFKEIKKDDNISLKLHEKACKEGSAKSCYQLGFNHNAGKGVPKDYTKAREYYKIACDAGYARACTRLGLLYGEGKGVKKDMEKAVNLFKKGCMGRHLDGCDLYKMFKRR